MSRRGSHDSNGDGVGGDDRTADDLERELQQAMEVTQPEHEQSHDDGLHRPPSPSQQHDHAEPHHNGSHRPSQLEQAMQRQREEHEANESHAAAARDDAAHSHHLSPHAFAEVSLAPSAPPADVAVSEGMPSLLSARCGRSFLYAFLLLLALANFLVALPQPEQVACRFLSNYALSIGVVLAAAGPFLHCFVRSGREVLMAPFVPFVVLGVLACAVIASVFAIGRLANDPCPSDRAMRQTVLADVMLVLGSALALGFYALLRWRFPTLQLSGFSQQVAKSSVLALVLSALVCDLANLIAHAPSGRMNYHWGLGVRPEMCQIDCPIPNEFKPELTARELTCFNAEGTMVDAGFCAEAEKPAPDDLALAPCPLPLCACTIQRSESCDHNATLYHYAVQFDAVDSPLKDPLGTQCIDPRTRNWGMQYPEIGMPGSRGGSGGRRPPPEMNGAGSRGSSMWWNMDGSSGPNLLQHRFQMRLGCRALPSNGAGEGAWVSLNHCAPWVEEPWSEAIDEADTVGSRQLLVPRPVPAPFTSGWAPLYFSLPESPCPQGCQSLWGSAVAFTAVFGVLALALAVSVLCNCWRGECEQACAGCCGGRRGGRSGLRGSAEAVEMHDAASASAAAVAIPNPDDLSVLPSPSPSSPGASAAVSTSAAHLSEPAPDASMRSLCLLLCRVLGVMLTQGFEAVGVWWRHALLFAGMMLLLSLSGVACWSMLWLVNANCRDFLLSAVMNAVVTSVLTIGALAIVIRNKQRVFDRSINPFESVGLLQREEEAINRQAEPEDEHEADAGADRA